MSSPRAKLCFSFLIFPWKHEVWGIEEGFLAPDILDSLFLTTFTKHRSNPKSDQTVWKLPYNQWFKNKKFPSEFPYEKLDALPFVLLRI